MFGRYDEVNYDKIMGKEANDTNWIFKTINRRQTDNDMGKAQEDKQYTQHRGILDTIFTNPNAGLLRVSNALGPICTHSQSHMSYFPLFIVCVSLLFN